MLRGNIIEFLNGMTPFERDNEGDWIVPDVPLLNKDAYDKYVIPNFIRCGAIPKKDLIVGRMYEGSCRNASKATWDGNRFYYTRYKVTPYTEYINHFEDDDGHDLFVPVSLVNDKK